MCTDAPCLSSTLPLSARLVFHVAPAAGAAREPCVLGIEVSGSRTGLVDASIAARLTHHVVQFNRVPTGERIVSEPVSAAEHVVSNWANEEDD